MTAEALEDETERDLWQHPTDLHPLPAMPEPHPRFATRRQVAKNKVAELRRTLERTSILHD